MDDSLTMPIQIGLAIALVLSFFASFLSAKTWKIGQIILVFMVFIAAGAFWILSAATLKLQQSHGQLVNKLQAELELENTTKLVLEQGRDAAEGDEAVLAALQRENEAYVAGLRQLEVELHNALLGRGRVWAGVTGGAPAADGTLSITIESPTPHALSTKSVVYVFEEGTLEEGANYLGEFAVTEAGEGTATLAPAITLIPAAQARLENSNKTWILYEQMPTDSHDMFTALGEDELRRLLPERTLSEYLKDGKPADADDPEDRVMTRKMDGEEQKFYQRQLRDYTTYFHELQLQFFMLRNLVEQKQKDNALLQETVAKANTDSQAREVEIANLESDLGHVKKEIEVITQHAQRVTAVAQRVQASAQKLLTQVQQQGRELGQLQLNSLREIEEANPSEEQTGITSTPEIISPASALVGP